MINDFKKKIFKSNLFKSAGIYTIFNLIDKCIPFLLLPLITRYLLPEEYGVYVLYQALVGFLFPFVSLNTDSATLINYFKLKKTEFNVYLVNGVTIFLINLIILVIINFFLNDYIANSINFPENFLYTVLLVCSLMYFSKLVKNLYLEIKNN